MSALGESPITRVTVDGIVALKMIKHIRESLPAISSGQLLGLAVDGTLEVTNCFPLVEASEEDDDETGYSQFDHVSLLEHLRTVNVDSNSVGWYTASLLASHLTNECVRSQFTYQAHTPLSIMLLYDPVSSSKGVMGIRALRLSSKFLSIFANPDSRREVGSASAFTRDRLAEVGLRFDQIYEELPVEIVNTGLLRAMIWEMEESPALQQSYSCFDLGSRSFLEKNLNMLIDSVNDLQQEQSKYQTYQRQLAKVQSQYAQALARRKAENLQRKSVGQPPLPESQQAIEAELASSIKMPVEPNRYESMLSVAQTNHYCEEILNFGGQDLVKLNIAKAAVHSSH